MQLKGYIPILRSGDAVKVSAPAETKPIKYVTFFWGLGVLGLTFLVISLAGVFNIVETVPVDIDILPLKHFGDYSVHLLVGGQSMWIMLDTGSSSFAVAPWWKLPVTATTYCSNPPCNNSGYIIEPPPTEYASALTHREIYVEGNWSGAAVQTNVILGSLTSSDALVWAMWSCWEGGCNKEKYIDGVMGLAYSPYACRTPTGIFYKNINQFDNVTCGSTNYGHWCRSDCNECTLTACPNVDSCDNFCTDTVNKFGQQMGRMAPLPTQLGIDMFGMYLCAGSDGSKFVVQNPLQKAQLYTGSVQWTPVTLLNAYNVETVDIFLQGTPPLTINGTSASTFLARGEWQHESLTYDGLIFPTNFDLGTSGMGMWNNYVIVAIMEMLLQNGFNVPDGVCYSEVELGKPLHEWPSIGLVFKGGSVMYVPASSYLNAQSIVGPMSSVFCNPGEYAWSIGPAGETSGATLGNGVMWPYYMVFDRAGGRVGWAQKANACP